MGEMKNLRLRAAGTTSAVLILALVLAAAALTGCGEQQTGEQSDQQSKQQSASPTTAQPTDETSSFTAGGEPKIDAVASRMLGVAGANGDSRPISGFFVATTAGEAAPVVSGTAGSAKSDASNPVYTFVIGGSFTAGSGQNRASTSAESGGWLVGSIDAESGELLEYAIVKKDPSRSVRALGKVYDPGFGPPAGTN